MKKRVLLLVTTIVFIGQSCFTTAFSQVVLSQDFEHDKIGNYTNTEITQNWQNIEWADVFDRATIINDVSQGKSLRLRYPQGGVGPKETGGQFEVNILPAEQYTLSYKVKFEQGFDFNKGGKLPGLTSGGSAFTGGRHPDNGEGWSARFMWREKGQAEVYLYYVDMKKKWGEQLPLKGIEFKTGQWYELKQHIQLNDRDKSDATIKAWVNGKLVMEKKNFRLRIGEQGLINCLYFSTFFGGNTKAWAPKNESFIRFDDFTITTY